VKDVEEVDMFWNVKGVDIAEDPGMMKVIAIASAIVKRGAWNMRPAAGGSR
jgi:hypothetical protein